MLNCWPCLAQKISWFCGLGLLIKALTNYYCVIIVGGHSHLKCRQWDFIVWTMQFLLSLHILKI